jgi:uncharacterized repeat protein (TIGR03803 family)
LAHKAAPGAPGNSVKVEILLWARFFLALIIASVGARTEAAVHYQQLKSFGFPEKSERTPNASVVEATDGALYGTTYDGGTGASGSVYRVNKDGTGYQVIHHFGVNPGDGKNPYSKVLEGTDGALYGTTWAGGTNGAGTVFKVNKDGTGYIVLRNFAGGADAQNPYSGVTEGTNQVLYGTTYNGGAHGVGTLFKLNKDGSAYAVLHSFNVGRTDGNYPEGELLQASDGLLYGSAFSGGNNFGGVLYRLNDDGTGYGILRQFGTNQDGTSPAGMLIEGSDGALYGTTYTGGSNNLGTVFTIGKDGNGYSILHNFQGSLSADGAHPPLSVIEGTNGMLYGTTENAACVYKLNKDGSGFGILRNFNTLDGTYLEAALLQASDGVFYGTASLGGLSDSGTLFKIEGDGSQFTVVHEFLDANGGDGTAVSGISEASNGVLYGTCESSGPDIGGTVFKLNKDGTGYGILHSFLGWGQSEEKPIGGVIEVANDSLFGVASDGGTNFLAGALFKIDEQGTNYSVVRLFGSIPSDGGVPLASLLKASSGVVYGTTYSGGSNGGGTVFSISADGTGYAVLHNFSGAGGEGINPEAPLIEGSDGAIYGTTWNSPGIGSGPIGGVFRMATNGGFSVPHSFGSIAGDGMKSNTGLAEGSDGAIYGETSSGGSSNVGTIFRVTKDGSSYSLLHQFGSSGDGQHPIGRLLRAWDQALYGTTSGGGSNGLGTVFRIDNSGSNYAILHHFGGGPADGASPSTLILGSDGILYGAATGGGAANSGVVFRLFPPQTPDMISAILSGQGVSVSFSGMGGFDYQLMRSSDLTNWVTIATITMPLAGVYTNLDIPPLGTQAYYRAAWKP